MPTYVYRCENCSTKYDVFHKSIESKEEVFCPVCKSSSWTKLIAAPNIFVYQEASSCACGGENHDSEVGCGKENCCRN